MNKLKDEEGSIKKQLDISSDIKKLTCYGNKTYLNQLQKELKSLSQEIKVDGDLLGHSGNSNEGNTPPPEKSSSDDIDVVGDSQEDGDESNQQTSVLCIPNRDCSESTYTIIKFIYLYCTNTITKR